MKQFIKKLSSRKKDKQCLKVLGIGNSFTVDATEYLWDICQHSGSPQVVVGRIDIGGCSLDMHWENIKENAKKYSFSIWYSLYKYSKKAATFKEALKREKWDVIVIQQVSHYAGDPHTYSNLQNIIDYIKKYCPKAKIMWQMTWAYQADSTHSGFAKYGNDQMTMYNAVVDTVKEKIVPNYNIASVIPSGTAIQNLRTVLGDTLTRDGFHMSLDFGRYTAALMWYKAITQMDISGINWVPNSYPYVSERLAEIKACVEKAFEKPFEISEI